MSKELKLLLISVGLVVAGVIALLLSARNCEYVEYQDLDGSHYVQVCEGTGE